jgi:hypothetical protein
MNKQVIKSLTANDATAQFEPGVIWEDGATGKAYRYVLIEDMSVTVGDVLEYSDTSGYEVTKDRSGGASIGRVVAGVAIGSITDAQYGWIQVSGRNASVKTDGAVTAGQGLVPHASVDGRADSEANGSTVAVTSGQVFGYALETDDGTTTAGTCAAILNCK